MLIIIDHHEVFIGEIYVEVPPDLKVFLLISVELLNMLLKIKINVDTFRKTVKYIIIVREVRNKGYVIIID